MPLQEEAQTLKPEVGPAPNFLESLDLSGIINNAVTSSKLQSDKKRINLKESISFHVEFAKKCQ